MNDTIFQAFLQTQFEAGRELAAQSDRLTLEAIGGPPPNRYIARFRCVGLAREAGDIRECDRWCIGVFFPENYLREPVDVAHLLTYLGPSAEPWHPNLRPPFVCMHVAFGAPLVDILLGLHELLTWNLYSTSDEGLNHAAAQWARHQVPARFPLDRRPLRRRARVPNITVQAKGACP